VRDQCAIVLVRSTIARPHLRSRLRAVTMTFIELRDITVAHSIQVTLHVSNRRGMSDHHLNHGRIAPEGRHAGLTHSSPSKTTRGTGSQPTRHAMHVRAAAVALLAAAWFSWHVVLVPGSALLFDHLLASSKQRMHSSFRSVATLLYICSLQQTCATLRHALVACCIGVPPCSTPAPCSGDMPAHFRNVST
jgi:hypothetical protein